MKYLLKWGKQKDCNSLQICWKRFGESSILKNICSSHCKKNASEGVFPKRFLRENSYFLVSDKSRKQSKTNQILQTSRLKFSAQQQTAVQSRKIFECVEVEFLTRIHTDF